MKLKLKLFLIRTWTRFDMKRKGYGKADLMIYLLDNK